MSDKQPTKEEIKYWYDEWRDSTKTPRADRMIMASRKSGKRDIVMTLLCTPPIPQKRKKKPPYKWDLT